MRLIKRYSNRKLYDTATRTYITLEAIGTLVMDGADIKVVDNDTDEDLTTVILSQLLLERERSRRSLSSGLLSGLLRSGETLGRGLSSLARPLPVSPGGLVGTLEHEVERSLKFWLELGQGSEEEVLRLIENLIETRRRGRAPLNLLRRRDLDDFENWNEPSPALTAQLKLLTAQATRLSQLLHENPPDEATSHQLETELAALNQRLATLLS